MRLRMDHVDVVLFLPFFLFHQHRQISCKIMMEAVRSVAWLADLHTQMAYQKGWTENEMLAGKSQKERKKKPWRMNDFMNERKLKSSSLGPRCVGSYHPGLRTSFSWEHLRDSPGIVI